MTSTTFEERTGRRDVSRGRPRACSWGRRGPLGAAYREMYRPTTVLGRVAHRTAHILWALVNLAITITLLALIVAATVATWRWIFSVLS